MTSPLATVVHSSVDRLLIVSGGSAETMDALRIAAAGTSPFRSVVTVLAGASNADLPDAGVVVIEGDGRVRLLVRGRVRAGAAGRVADASGVTTWQEQVWAGVDEVTLSLAVEHATVCASLAVINPAGKPLESVQDHLDPLRPVPVPTRRLQPALDAARRAAPEAGQPPRGRLGEDTLIEGPEVREDGPASTAEPPLSSTRAAAAASPVAPAKPAVDESGYFGHLLHETRYDSVEAAAIRLGEEPVREEEGMRPSEAGPPPVHETAAPAPVAEAVIAPATGEGTGSPAPPHAESLIGLGLIDRVPGRGGPRKEAGTGGGGSSTPAGPAVPGPCLPPATASSHLQPAQAPIRRDETVSSASVQALLAEVVPVVQAVHCESVHPNPPHADVCAACGKRIVDRAVLLVPRPALGRLRFSDGQLHELTGTVLIGRKPPGVGTAVTLQDAEVSRVHTEVRVEEWQALVVDQDSRNHTYVDVEGRPRQQLRPFEPLLLPRGATLRFGDNAWAVFEATP